MIPKAMLSVAFFFFFVSVSANQVQAASVTDLNEPDQPLFVVTKNHDVSSAEGMAKAGDVVMIRIVPHGGPEDHYNYRIGDEYQLFFGGKNKGKIKIKKVVGLCGRDGGKVTLPPDFKLAETEYALATNSKTVKPHKSNRSLPSASEKESALKLAATEFKNNGSAFSSLSQIKIKNLIVTALGEHSSKIMFGSFENDAQGTFDHLFIVSELKDDLFGEASVAIFSHATDIDDKAFKVHTFVDQLDLDGDGTDEIIVEKVGYEEQQFLVYKKEGNNWKIAARGEKGGC